MKWDKYIEYLASKTKYLIFVFSKLTKILNANTLLVVYYALFNSIITYGIVVWGGAYKSNLKPIQNIQDKILKKIVRYLSVESYSSSLSVSQLGHYEALRYYYNTLKYNFENNKSTTRNKNLILSKRCKNISGKNSYIVAVKLFKKLPNNLKVLQNAGIVKKSLKKWIKCNV